VGSAHVWAAQVGNLDGEAPGQAGAHRLDPGDGQLDPEVHVLVVWCLLADRGGEVTQHQRLSYPVAHGVGTGGWKLRRPGQKDLLVSLSILIVDDVPEDPESAGVAVAEVLHQAAVAVDPHPRLLAGLKEAVYEGYKPGEKDYTALMGKLKAAGIDAELKLKEYGAFISSTIYGKFDHMYIGLRGAWADPESYFYRIMMPGQSMNVLGVNDPKLTEMIKLQRRTFDEKKRREIVHDIQRHVAQNVYYGYGASVSCVSAWMPYVKNFGPNIGHDMGGRLLAAWIDK